MMNTEFSVQLDRYPKQMQRIFVQTSICTGLNIFAGADELVLHDICFVRHKTKIMKICIVH